MAPLQNRIYPVLVIGTPKNALPLYCTNIMYPNLVPLTRLQGDSKQHILGGIDIDHFGLGEDVVARAELPAELRLPVRHIPLEPLGRDAARFLDGKDTDPFVEHVLLAVLPHPDLVPAGLEQKRQTLPAEEVHAALVIARMLLVEVEVVQLAQPLVDTPAEAADGNNVYWQAMTFPHIVDSFGKVG